MNLNQTLNSLNEVCVLAYINVNYNQIMKTASDVDTYVNKLKQSMKEIDWRMWELNSNWKGKDSTVFFKEWSDIKSNNSTSSRMLTSLENYSNSLKFAANRYRDIQLQAISRATRYCK